jgi:hypothetical protein
MVLGQKPKPSRSLPGTAGLFGAGGVIGLVSSWVGIGGGTLSGRPVRAVQCGGPLGAYFPRSMFDTPDDYEPLVTAGKLLADNGIKRSSRKSYCYVLIGYDGDTMEKAEKRLRDTWKAGFFPFAMLYRDEKGEVQHDWKQFQRLWARPQIINQKLKEGNNA